MSRKSLFLIGGASIIGLGLIGWFQRRKIKMAVSQLPSIFTLAKNAYNSVEAWASDRGEQIRIALGITREPQGLKPEGPIGPKGIATDEWNRRKIATLAAVAQPRFTPFLAEAQAIARRNGAELMIWDATRSLERQLELYKKGRTVPGDTVTYIVHSNHLPGLAVDLIFRTPNGNPSFEWPVGSKKYPSWYFKEVLPLAAKHGLQSLYLAAGKDGPHVEMVEGAGPVVASLLKQIKQDFPGLT